MMPNEMPPCFCGSKREWIPGGGHMGGALNTQWFKCPDCGRHALMCHHGGGNLLLQKRDFDPSQVDEDHTEFTDEDDTYINEVLMATWRTAEAEKKAIQDKAHDHMWAGICVLMGLEVGTKVYDAPEEKRDKYRDMLDAMYTDDYRSPPCWTPAYPPQLPRRFYARILRYQKKERTWVDVDHDASAKLPIPPDPIRVHHDEFWAGVFKELGEKTGIEIRPTHSANEYYPENGGNRLEPWFRFSLNGKTIVCGPRKRVNVVRVESLTPFSVKSLRDLAKADGVTYGQEGDERNDMSTRASIHAWGREKLMEYLLDVSLDVARIAKEG